MHKYWTSGAPPASAATHCGMHTCNIIVCGAGCRIVRPCGAINRPHFINRAPSRALWRAQPQNAQVLDVGGSTSEHSHALRHAHMQQHRVRCGLPYCGALWGHQSPTIYKSGSFKGTLARAAPKCTSIGGRGLHQRAQPRTAACNHATTSCAVRVDVLWGPAGPSIAHNL